MAKQVKAIVIAGNGTNCEREVAYACKMAGADRADIIHIAELLAGRIKLDEYQLLNLAGGFLDGDDLGSAKAGANRLLHAKVRKSGLPDYSDKPGCIFPLAIVCCMPRSGRVSRRSPISLNSLSPTANWSWGSATVSS